MLPPVQASSTMFPLQAPGGPELLVIALIFLILAAIVVAVVYLLRRAGASVSDRQRRTEELEERVAELEAKYEPDSRTE